MSSQEGKYLSAAQVAERLGVTPQAINKWIRKGLFPGAYKINPFSSNSPYRIPIQAVEAFEQERQRATPSPDQ